MPDLAIHDIFAANAERHPARPGVVGTRGPRTPERVFTYRQINESSNQLAHHFLAHGCQLGDVVIVYAHRGSVAHRPSAGPAAVASAPDAA